MKELAADGIPVTVTCRVLKLARAPYYRWLRQPITNAQLVEAYRANALFDAHKDDPEFGHRFLVDEAADHGEAMSVRTAWRICRDNGWWSAFGKRSRGKNGKKAGPPVHDDRVGRGFTAESPNELWLTDITEHRTGEGKLYLCAIKDVFSNRIVGYSISDHMKSRLAVRRPRERRRTAAEHGWLHRSQRQGRPVPREEIRADAASPRPRRVDGQGRRCRGQRGHGVVLQPAAEERPRPPFLGHPRAAAHRDRHLDRADLPPAPQAGPPGPFDADRVRDHHEHATGPRGLTNPCHLSVQQAPTPQVLLAHLPRW